MITIYKGSEPGAEIVSSFRERDSTYKRTLLGFGLERALGTIRFFLPGDGLSCYYNPGNLVFNGSNVDSDLQKVF